MHVIFTRYFNPAVDKEYFPGDILRDVDAFTFDYLTLNRYAKNYTIPQRAISEPKGNPISAATIFFETLSLGMALVLFYLFALSLPYIFPRAEKLVVLADATLFKGMPSWK